MSSPIDPLASTPAPVPSPVPANGQAASDDQIRLLAEQINNAGSLGFTPGTFTKAVVQGIDEGSSTVAPSISVYLSGDSTTLVSGVRFLSTYSPTVGDTVLLIKLGSELVALAQYARRDSGAAASNTEGGWIQASLSSGNGHGGNGNGNLMYRRVQDNGCWKMQWKGGISFGGSTSILAAPLDAIYCPAQKQSTHSARSVITQGGVSVGLDFLTNGNITIVAAQWTTSTTSSNTSHAAPGGLTGTISSHSHPTPGTSANGGHNHSVQVDDHWHNLNGHYHTANVPDWISFTGVEYFLG